jgi:dethiobiotin synthetase
VTINHTLLSLEALRRRGCDVAGVMLNETQPVAQAERYIHEDNVHAIEHFGEVAVRHIPYLRTAAEAPFESGSGAAAHTTEFQFATLDAIVDHCRFVKECLL